MRVAQIHTLKFAIGLAIVAAVSTAVVDAQTPAQPGRSLLVRPAAVAQPVTTTPPVVTPTLQPTTTSVPTLAQPAQQPVIDEGVSAPNSLPSPDAIVGEATVSKAPSIKYDTDREARRMYASGSVNMIMVTENPADHCVYEIPLCIPACVTGEPKVSSHCGLFGRGVVEYCWPSGFEVSVKFRNVGDIRVDYEGD
jgi:hypothetical protein